MNDARKDDQNANQTGSRRQLPTDEECIHAAVDALFLEIMGWKLPSTPVSLQPEAPEEKE